jgi:mannose-6-phosphate isomerase-like protein (cupin superfamily)
MKFQGLVSKVVQTIITIKMAYTGNIIKETTDNTYFRKVIYTGGKSQLVVMDIKPNESIGAETHQHTEQTLFLLSGEGKSILDGVETPFMAGDVVVVTPGTKHDFVNTGTSSLKIFTIYAPANHIDGRIHKTKAEAEADTDDEAFGESVE